MSKQDNPEVLREGRLIGIWFSSLALLGISMMVTYVTPQPA
ncbi:UNVERIFIED_ORG: hypothetical protein GGD51_001753 [Rhizobium esperanzae]